MMMPTIERHGPIEVRLEIIARHNGIAVGVATALPVSIACIAKWAKVAETRGFLLVPISATAARPKIDTAGASPKTSQN